MASIIVIMSSFIADTTPKAPHQMGTCADLHLDPGLNDPAFLLAAVQRVKSCVRIRYEYVAYQRVSAAEALRECAASKARRTRSNTAKDNVWKHCATARKSDE